MGFGIGMPEMLVIMVIAVLLFGNRLPSVMRSLGQGVTEFKKGISDIKSEVDAATASAPGYTRPAAPPIHSDDYDEPTAPKFEPPTGEPT